MAKKENKKLEVKRKRRMTEKQRAKHRASLAKTQNGRNIVNLMTEEKIRGSFKDYVIIIGDRLIDWKRTMNLRADDGKPVRVDAPVLVHKKKLKNVISPEAAAEFWHPVFGRLVDGTPATKPKGK